MQLSTCVKWRRVRHVITDKNDQRIIIAHDLDSHLSAFERGPNLYCTNLRCPWWRCKVVDTIDDSRDRDVTVDCPAYKGKVKKNWVSAEWQRAFRTVKVCS